MTEPVRTSLYRIYDTEERLLYVGIASNPGRRYIEHAKGQRWWDQVGTIELEHFGSRAEAMEAERLAILEEKPLYNIVHNAGVTRERVDFYCDNCGDLVVPGTGHVEVPDAVVAEARRQRLKYEAERREDDWEGPAPHPATWRVWHRQCNPDIEAASYYIDVDRIQTWRDVVNWTTHLMEKAWLQDTDWRQFLGRLLGGGRAPSLEEQDRLDAMRIAVWSRNVIDQLQSPEDAE